MKKTFAILCALIMLILTSCDNHDKTQTDTTTLIIREDISAGTTVNEAEEESIVNSNISTTQNSLETTKKSTASTTFNSSGEGVQGVPPYILTESIEDLKQIKVATKTMDETEFSSYMKSNFNTETVNGMDSIENAEKYLTDFENAYVIYVDEFAEDNVMAYYIEYGDISYKIPVDGVFVLTGSYYVNPEKTFEYKERDSISHLKTYEVNGMTIELYENTVNETEGLYGNIRYDNTTIPFFTNVKISVEQFESVLPRIGIVKIGDLLNE